MSAADTETATPTEHRSRLLEGMAQCVAAQGYADTTIADIVREAGVSRRTFYEHFSDKAACLVALYEAASQNALAVLRSSVDPQRGWQEQVESAIGAYLGVLASNPVLMRTLFVDILGLGLPGLAARRHANQQLADFMQEVVNQPSSAGPVLHGAMAMAVVGGINELVLQAIEQDQVARLGELVAPASALLRAAVTPPPETEVSKNQAKAC
jgi:AcrR family transcriptional regulator